MSLLVAEVKGLSPLLILNQVFMYFQEGILNGLQNIAVKGFLIYVYFLG